tara:strand:- start:3058 stop:3378 length:321 start_codon:yes stop_codon:yes gene_type:complete
LLELPAEFLLGGCGVPVLLPFFGTGGPLEELLLAGNGGETNPVREVEIAPGVSVVVRGMVLRTGPLEFEEPPGVRMDLRGLPLIPGLPGRMDPVEPGPGTELPWIW